MHSNSSSFYSPTKRWAEEDEDDNFLPAIPWAPHIKPVSLKSTTCESTNVKSETCESTNVKSETDGWTTVKSKKKKK